MAHYRNTIPINRNFLSQLDFKFILKRAPSVNFFVQRVNIPKLVLPAIGAGNPFTRIPYAGDHIEWAPLGIQYKIDEDFKNYFEIYNWIRGLGFPKEFQEYADIEKKDPYTGEGIRSDIHLMILNSVKQTNIEIVFEDCIPTSLSDLEFDTTDLTVDYLEATATFDYIKYEIKTEGF